MAKFKINNIFKITDRGMVVSGEIIEGEISAGDVIRLETDGKIIELTIKSIEFLLIKSGHEEVAFMLGPIDNNAITILEKMTDKTVFITRIAKPD